MNRPHPSQQFYPPRQYQASPGPPQPQWQASPAPPSGPGWSDPRIHPPPPTAPPGATYNPNMYAPAPTTVYSPISPPQPSPPDTAVWGVRYNQNQQYAKYQEPKPPLPPRPPSVGGYGASAGQQTQTAGSWSQAQGASSYAPAPQWQHDAYGHQQTQQTPPPPPPRPPEYLSLPQETQGWPHPQYSHNPPSHHYEPSNQHPYQSGGPGDQFTYQAGSAPEVNPTVSPIEEPTIYWRPPPPQTLPNDARNQADSEARKPTPQQNFGGPLDWEHFDPIGDHAENTNHSETPTTPTAPTYKQDAYHQRPPADMSYVATEDHVAQVSQQPQPDEPLPEQKSPVSSATAASPIVLPSAPAPLSMSRGHQGLSDRSDSPSLRNKESPSFNVTVPQRTGTIDGIIQAWNKPLERESAWHVDKPISSGASSRQSSVSALSATKPQDDSAETTKRSPKQRLNSNPYLPTNVANFDPYADLEPEYRASLSRYVTMLRKESAASSEASKFNIFKAFVDKELRLRSVLYGQDGGGTEATKAADEIAVQLSSSTKVNESRDEQHPGMSPTPNPEGIPVVKDAGGRVSTSKNTLRPESPKLVISISSESNEASSTAVDQFSDDLEYSPGGRPKVSKLQTVPKNPLRPSPTINAATSASGTISTKGPASPGDSAPIVLEDYSTGGPEYWTCRTKSQALAALLWLQKHLQLIH
jgi:hypothetical protein